MNWLELDRTTEPPAGHTRGSILLGLLNMQRPVVWLHLQKSNDHTFSQSPFPEFPSLRCPAALFLIPQIPAAPHLGGVGQRAEDGLVLLLVLPLVLIDLRGLLFVLL